MNPLDDWDDADPIYSWKLYTLILDVCSKDRTEAALTIKRDGRTVGFCDYSVYGGGFVEIEQDGFMADDQRLQQLMELLFDWAHRKHDPECSDWGHKTRQHGCTYAGIKSHDVIKPELIKELSPSIYAELCESLGVADEPT